MKNYLTITIETMESPVNLARKSVAEREAFSIGGMKFLAFGMNSNRESVASMDAIQIYLDPIPEWNGYGLPPVGTVCEVQTWVNREWRQTKVLAHHLGFAIHSWSVEGDDMEVESAPAQDFRPIRTPEQIAAEARQQKIEAMAELLSRNTECPSPYVWELAQKAIDLGYIRKEEP